MVIEEKYTIMTSHGTLTSEQLKNLKTNSAEPPKPRKLCPYRAGTANKECKWDCALFNGDGCGTVKPGGRCPIDPANMTCSDKCNFYKNGKCAIVERI